MRKLWLFLVVVSDFFARQTFSQLPTRKSISVMRQEVGRAELSRMSTVMNLFLLSLSVHPSASSLSFGLHSLSFLSPFSSPSA